MNVSKDTDNFYGKKREHPVRNKHTLKKINLMAAPLINIFGAIPSSQFIDRESPLHSGIFAYRGGKIVEQRINDAGQARKNTAL